MSSRPWRQFGTGDSCGGSGSGSGSGGCGSGSSASSKPAVVTSSSALPKAICDAPVKLSRASAPRSDWQGLGRDCQRPAVKIFDKKDQKLNYTLMNVLTELSKTECMLGVTSL